MMRVRNTSARKPMRCGICNGVIQVGMAIAHFSATEVGEKDLHNYAEHVSCADRADAEHAAHWAEIDALGPWPADQPKPTF